MIQLRGRAKYQLANDALYNELNIDLMTNPEKVALPSVAFKVAVWIWKNSYLIKSKKSPIRGSLNELIDGTFHNFTLLTHSLTDNIQSLIDRANFNDRILSELRFATIKRGRGVECSVNEEKGYAVPVCLLDFKRPYCGCEGKFDKRSCPYGLNDEGKCRNSALIKCCIESCKSLLDLVVLFDSSGSIGPYDFNKEKRFVINLLENLVIGPNDTRVAIINFSTRSEILTDFKTFKNMENVRKVINKADYLDEKTYTNKALKQANDIVLQEQNGMRPIDEGVPKVVLVVTDGASTDNTKTLEEAARIKRRGFNIITVGVGQFLNIEELIDMASSPSDQYLANNFDQISLILSSLSKSTCQQPAEIKVEKEITASVPKDAYKYFKYSLKPNETNQTIPRVFTIQLEQLSGVTDLYFSFTEENPKSNDDYLSLSEVKYEPAMLRSRIKYYQVKRPDNLTSNLLYFSVKGREDVNQFQVIVNSKMIGDASAIKFNGLLLIMAIFGAILFSF